MMLSAVYCIYHFLIQLSGVAICCWLLVVGGWLCSFNAFYVVTKLKLVVAAGVVIAAYFFLYDAMMQKPANCENIFK